MIKGFEHITIELTKDEMELLPTIIRGLTNKKDKSNDNTINKISEPLKILSVAAISFLFYFF